jgi:hypothetical protein
MTVSPEERLLIDRYLDGTLSGLELQRFMERLDSDEEFRAVVSMQNLLVEGIVISADKELHRELLQSLAYRKPRVPMGLKLIFTFFLVTILGLVLWNYIGPDSGTEKKHFLTFSWLPHLDDKKNNSKRMNAEADVEKDSKENVSKDKSKKANDVAEANPENTEADGLASEDSIPELFSQDDEKEVVVKKDQLLISQSIFIQEDTVVKSKNGKVKGKKKDSFSEEVANKLDPSAGLEFRNSDPQKPSHLIVEFWVSPINYRGYKMHRNKLILFGMEEPDAITLFRKDDRLYMRHLNDYYILEPNDDFSSYQPVKDKDFISQLK